MRQLKFKQPFYDGKKFKSWRHWGFIGNVQGNFIEPQAGYDYHPDSPHYLNKHYQFTGQQVNGQDIWEGDILRDAEMNHLEVQWDDCIKGFTLYRHNTAGCVPFHLAFRELTLKIIGNIIENPELLEAYNENTDK